MTLHIAPAVTTIAQTIQLSLAPVFLLSGIGAVLGVFTGRLARVIDRVRALEESQVAPGAEGERQRWELGQLDRRMRIINLAIYLVVGAAIMTCTVVASLFIAEVVRLRIGPIVALCFVVAMLLLIAGLLAFLVEVHVSLVSNRVRPELLLKTRDASARPS